MKNIKLIILTSIISLSLSACKKNINSNASAKNIIASMQNVENFENGSLEDISKSEVAERYGITPEDIEEGYVYYPKEEERSDKIIIIKAKDKNSVENIERALSLEIIGLTDSWKNVEKEAKKVENHLFKTRDIFTVLYIGENKEEIENIFNKYIEA